MSQSILPIPIGEDSSVPEHSDSVLCLRTGPAEPGNEGPGTSNNKDFANRVDDGLLPGRETGNSGAHGSSTTVVVPTHHGPSDTHVPRTPPGPHGTLHTSPSDLVPLTPDESGDDGCRIDGGPLVGTDWDPSSRVRTTQEGGGVDDSRGGPVPDSDGPVSFVTRLLSTDREGAVRRTSSRPERRTGTSVVTDGADEVSTVGTPKDCTGVSAPTGRHRGVVNGP